MKTLGLSPKAVLAFLFPVIAATATSLVAWIAGGEVFDVEPIKVALGGLVASGLAALGAFAGKPGIVVAKAREEGDLHDAPGA
jgi:hypothetical protein